MIRTSVLSLLAVAALASAPAAAAEWDFDTAHSRVGFSVKHLKIAEVEGEFQKFTGKVNWDEKDITKSTVAVEIDTSSVNTREEKRDGHLKSPDFFDTAKFPKMTFKSTKVEKAKDGTLLVTGDLTIKDVTKPVVLTVVGPSEEVKDPWGNPHVAFQATTTINRKDYGLNWNKALEKGGFLVGDDVKIKIDVELVKPQPAPAKKS